MTVHKMATNGTSEKPSSNAGEELKATSPAEPGAAETPVPPPVPDLNTSPAEFLTYLKSVGLDELTSAWEHLQKPPVRLASSNRYQESAITAWSDTMDILVVSTDLCLLIFSCISHFI